MTPSTPPTHRLGPGGPPPPPPSAATNRVAVLPVAPVSSAPPADSIDLEPSDERPLRFPEVGDTFLGFRLVEELGRGSFGRVFVAHQGDLSGRPVALKIATDIFGESQTLAQLQHTNIVPIYSYHRAGPYQAVCMPLFGRTTLAGVLEKLTGRGALPSSGRELVSTLNMKAADTAAASAKSAGPKAAPAPAAPEHAADGWTRVEGLSYVEAVLWLGAQLAEGLAHAHARGILHSDLKPANVLLTDDGRPMLLDFNLAQDRKPGATRGGIGGTLPYMAPEHLRAFRDRTDTLDARCDVYSLGVILFELLTGRHPFPVHRGPIKDTLPLTLADRTGQPPTLRDKNAAVSPAVEAIVRRCLAPDPAARYQSADQLREDIDRQLTHRPLRHAPNPSHAERARKWARRHPRATSSATVGAAAVVLIATLAATAGVIWDREQKRVRLVEAQAAADAEKAADLRALGTLGDHRTAFADTRLFLVARDRSAGRVEDGFGKLRGVLDRYAVPGDAAGGWLDGDAVRRLPAADRDAVQADVGEALYLTAQLEFGRALGAADPAERASRLAAAEKTNAAAAAAAGGVLPRAVVEQRAALAALRGDTAAAQKLRAEAAAAAPTARDEYLLGVQLAHQHEYRRAATHLTAATELDTANYPAWLARGSVYLHLGQPELALMCYTACVARRDDFAPAWRNRGFAFARMRQFELAVKDYDRALALAPDDAETYLLRSDAKFARRDLAGAEADLTAALATGKAPVRAYFLRANVRHWTNNEAGAAADKAAGLKLTPGDPLSWVGRAEQRAEDPAAALGDVEQALKLDPLLLDGFQMKAHLLTELKRPAEAEAVLDRAVNLYPDSAPARAGRGVLLARAGKHAAAVRDAKDALLIDTRPPNAYQVACIYALTSPARPDDRREAFVLLWSALKTGFGLDLVDTDTDLDPLRADPEFRRIVERARELHPVLKP